MNSSVASRHHEKTAQRMKPLIVALDVETSQEALGLTKKLSGYVDVFKVGPVLFLKYGGTLLSDLHAAGAKILQRLGYRSKRRCQRRS